MTVIILKVCEIVEIWIIFNILSKSILLLIIYFKLIALSNLFYFTHLFLRIKMMSWKNMNFFLLNRINFISTKETYKEHHLSVTCILIKFTYMK